MYYSNLYLDSLKYLNIILWNAITALLMLPIILKLFLNELSKKEENILLLIFSLIAIFGFSCMIYFNHIINLLK